MKLPEVMRQLKEQGSEQTKKVLLRHGAREPFFGVKVEFLKKLQKAIKQDHELALELYATGNSDAMYLAGLISDPARMTKRDLQRWAREAYWYMLSEYTVAATAAESRYGMELGLKWIESKQENVAAAGWATLAGLASVADDADLDVDAFVDLLDRAANTIHDQPNRVKYAMNQFVIAVGAYIRELTSRALAAARKIGAVQVNMGRTSCKVPLAEAQLRKIIDMGRVGKKRKTAKC